jgi:HK97 family phage major capsid protein
MLSNQAILEISDLSHRAERLAKGSATERKQADILVQRISSIKQIGISSDETRVRYAHALSEELNPTKSDFESRYKQAFLKYITAPKSTCETELRDLLSGTQSILYTAGPAAGFTVPMQTEKEIFEAIAQTDSLLSEDVCSFSVENSPTLQPKQLTGYDLSTVSAQQILESNQQLPQSFPAVAGRTLRNNIIFRTAFGVSWESDTDIPDLLGKVARAAGVAFARELGQQSIVGNGTTSMQGILTALPTPSFTTAATAFHTGLAYTDISGIFFALNRIYRSSPKCAWLMHDTVYQRVRQSIDNANRPLLDMTEDGERLMGKKVFICPSLPALSGFSLGTNSTIIFGDLSHFFIRCSKPTLQRVTQASIADITTGRSQLVGRIRADAAVFDPSNGSAPPIITATVTY